MNTTSTRRRPSLLMVPLNIYPWRSSNLSYSIQTGSIGSCYTRCGGSCIYMQTWLLRYTCQTAAGTDDIKSHVCQPPVHRIRTPQLGYGIQFILSLHFHFHYLAWCIAFFHYEPSFRYPFICPRYRCLRSPSGKRQTPRTTCYC